MQLQRIRIHPVKSLDGLDVHAASFTASGCLDGDRRWCLFGRDPAAQDLAFVTKVDKTAANSVVARTLVRFGATPETLTLELDGVVSPEFRLPADRALMSAWCSTQFGVELRLVESSDHGWPDVYVYLGAERATAVSGPTVISTATLAFLSEQLRLPTEELVRRLRANLVVHADELDPFGEDELKEIELGDVRLAVVGAVQRCPVPARDATTGTYDSTFTRRFVDAKASCRVGRSLSRDELYTASVYTRVLTPSATLVVAE